VALALAEAASGLATAQGESMKRAVAAIVQCEADNCHMHNCKEHRSVTLFEALSMALPLTLEYGKLVYNVFLHK
jgi:hypothetical protein